MKILTAYVVDQIENFAQEVNIALLDKNLRGGLSSNNLTQWRGVENQMRSVQTLLGNQLLPGGECDSHGRMEVPGISE